MGLAALPGWAEQRVAATERDIRQQPSIRRHGKKNSAGTRNSATLEILEPQYRSEATRVCPFILGVKVNPLGCSRRLQRAIVYFAEAIAPDAAVRRAWIETQTTALKSGCLDAALAACCEASEIGDQCAPVRRCHRYLSTRRSQLDYSRALADGPPIGSGEIESAHRFVARQRLKRPGAWWRVEHAEHMLALRIVRINGDWEIY
jgi:hypothetical protein